MAAPKAIIFDLGNVLLPIDLDKTYAAFSAYSSFNQEEIGSIIIENHLWIPYESGQQTDFEFREFLRSRLDLTISILSLMKHSQLYYWIFIQEFMNG